jgi:hypothetical protein
MASLGSATSTVARGAQYVVDRQAPFEGLQEFDFVACLVSEFIEKPLKRSCELSRRTTRCFNPNDDSKSESLPDALLIQHILLGGNEALYPSRRPAKGQWMTASVGHLRTKTMSDATSLPKFSGEELEAIVEAIVSGYDYDDWGRTLAYKWGIVLANEFNIRQGFRGVVADLVAWTERKGKTRELLALACADNPDNESLKQLAILHRLGNSRQQCGTFAAAKTSANLEALVNAHSRLIDYSRFMSRMQSIGDRVCLVETPFKKGTGFLVASDCVITNYHVVEEVVGNPSLAKRVTCSFDYRQTSNGAALTSIKQFGLRPHGVLANSPYDKSDLTGFGEPQLDKLDYAILQLAEEVGCLPGCGDDVRGWFHLVSDVTARPVVALQDFLFIPQHAAGNPLEIAWGNVVSFPGTGNRMRYDVTTASGSSGSPCFTIDLDIIGLHHAAEPGSNPQYNQAIPLWVIAKDLETKAPNLTDGRP